VASFGFKKTSNACILSYELLCVQAALVFSLMSPVSQKIVKSPPGRGMHLMDTIGKEFLNIYIHILFFSEIFLTQNNLYSTAIYLAHHSGPGWQRTRAIPPAGKSNNQLFNPAFDLHRMPPKHLSGLLRHQE
jgi:hypothetical protein